MDREQKAELEFQYRGSLGILVFWLLWSLAGYFFLIFYRDQSSLLEYIYLISAIGAVMALNNRKYGTNHEIRFYNDHMVVPKVINIWHWDEEIIFYHDIKEIAFHDHAHIGEKNFCEIELKTSSIHYPILGKKMSVNEFKNVYESLKIKTGLKTVDLPPILEGKSRLGLKKWQKSLLFVAFFVSVWTISMIGLAAPYHNLINGGPLFFIAFPLSFLICLFFQFKIKDVENRGQKFQKIFMLFYIAFYSGIGGAFSLVYFNGIFDDSPSEKVKMIVVNENYTETSQGACVEMISLSDKVDPLKSSRLPASSDHSQQKIITICQKNFSNIKVGDKFEIWTHHGALGEPWVSKVEKMLVPPAQK